MGYEDGGTLPLSVMRTLEDIPVSQQYKLSPEVFIEQFSAAPHMVRLLFQGSLLEKERTVDVIEDTLDKRLISVEGIKGARSPGQLKDEKVTTFTTIGDLLCRDIDETGLAELQKRYPQFVEGVASAFVRSLLTLPHARLACHIVTPPKDFTELLLRTYEYDPIQERAIRAAVEEEITEHLTPLQAVVLAQRYGLYSGLRESLEVVRMQIGEANHEAVRQIEVRAKERLIRSGADKRLAVVLAK